MARAWLTDLREKAGMTHKKVALEAGIERQYYGMIEKGVRNPSVAVAKRISHVLGFNWTLFFEQKGNESFRSGLIFLNGGEVKTNDKGSKHLI